MPTRRMRGAAVTTALAAAVTACSAPGSGDSGDGKSAGSVVIRVASEPDTLSPLLGWARTRRARR